MVTSVRLPEELERAVLGYAERHDVSKSTAMRRLMEDGLAGEDPDRELSALEDRLSAVERTLTELGTAIGELHAAIEDSETTVGQSESRDSAPGAPTSPDHASEAVRSTAVATIPAGPQDNHPTHSASEDPTEQAPIAEWNDGGSLPQEGPEDRQRPEPVAPDRS